MKRKTVFKLTFTAFLLLFLTTAMYFFVPAFWADDVYPLKYTDYIKKYSTQYGVDPALVAAVILQESRFNPNAVSPMGARGLMQFMPGTAATMARELGFAKYDIFNPETSVEFGAAHLRDLLAKYNGDIDQALASYNAGTGTVDRWVNLNIFERIINSDSKGETVRYVKKVKNYQTVYATMYWRDLGIENPIKLKDSAVANEKDQVRGFVWSQIFTNFADVISGN